MSLTMLVVLLVVAGVCGAIGQSIVGYSHMGCLGTIAVGFVGAYLGTWLAATFHLPDLLAVRIAGETFPVIWSIVGSALFVALISAVSGRFWRYREV